jgi:hypothetical protein
VPQLGEAREQPLALLLLLLQPSPPVQELLLLLLQPSPPVQELLLLLLQPSPPVQELLLPSSRLLRRQLLPL